MPCPSRDVWPLEQYKICLNSGVSENYSSIVPRFLVSEADYSFPASCETTGKSILPIRNSGTVIWIAPDGTTEFRTGENMTKAEMFSTSVKTPKKSGEYRIYALDENGTVLSKSSHILRISGSGSIIEAEKYSVQSGTDNENCSEGGQDVAYIENGDYIGFRNIDFGSGVESADFRIGANNSGSSLEVHFDSPDGKLIGTLEITSTGGWQTWNTQTCQISKTSGIHDVYFVFKGGEGYLYNLNWWTIDAGDDEEILKGDINADGVITSADLVALGNWLVGRESGIVEWEAGDFDESGSLDVFDLMLMRNYLLKRRYERT